MIFFVLCVSSGCESESPGTNRQYVCGCVAFSEIGRYNFPLISFRQCNKYVFLFVVRFIESVHFFFSVCSFVSVLNFIFMCLVGLMCRIQPINIPMGVYQQ